MPIIQISKIQQRSGNLVDLPQLDNAQFGWAYDQNRLFIGRSGPNVTNENIEVLTSYSNLSFSQVDGSDGSNVYITTPQPGQVLTYDSTLGAFINSGGNAISPNDTNYYSNSNIHLGNVSNVFLGGGAIGYVLETDGYGSLSWTPKTTVVANITQIQNTAGNVIIMTVPPTTPYINAAQVTIAGVTGSNASANNNANTILNSHVFYIKVANDYPTSGNVTLYTDSALSVTANGFGLQTSNTGTATTAVVNTGITYAAGSNTSIQYNNGGVIDGSANLTISGSNLTLSGNFIVSNVIASNTITATSFIGNLLTNAQTNITSVGPLINLSVVGNANIGNIGTAGIITATGNITGGNLNTSNLVSTGTLTVTANANIGNIGTGGLITATGNIRGANLVTGGVLSVTSNANIGNIGTAGIITATGTITGGALSTTGNANVGNIGTTGVFSTTLSATGNANIGNIGVGGILTVTGNVSTSNVVVSSYFIQSITAGATATGTLQANALAITRSIIECTTVALNTGVVLPTAVAGMTITVVNSGANPLNVYPASGAAINSGSTNAAYILAVGSRLQFFATSTTRWYTLNATYA